LTACDLDCLSLLGRAGEPLSAERIRRELDKTNMAVYSLATLKRSLARLHERGIADNNRCTPRGYYLPERLPLFCGPAVIELRVRALLRQGVFEFACRMGLPFVPIPGMLLREGRLTLSTQGRSTACRPLADIFCLTNSEPAHYNLSAIDGSDSQASRQHGISAT
jgi:hypothetical protein